VLAARTVAPVIKAPLGSLARPISVARDSCAEQIEVKMQNNVSAKKRILMFFPGTLIRKI
jgi:hypothetical protein